MLDTLPYLLPGDFPPLRRVRLASLQVNLGYRCNQQCQHCHVDAGPRRTEEMSAQTLDEVLDFIHRSRLKTLDITGGAPELNPGFRRLVIGARARGLHVMDRCNLTILVEPGFEDLADFLAEHQVEVMASLPCYLEENVDRQRGDGVFAKSIAGLQRLNALGYGEADSGLQLSLVYNPLGSDLPPSQCVLEQDYRKELGARFGIRFNRLLTLANMPIRRFGSMLLSKGEFAPYMSRLKSAHQDENLQSVMCRELISVDWQGRVFDCDFNQMLGLGLSGLGPTVCYLRDLDARGLDGVDIRVGDHCYGCTAGQGSSCGGALS
jgi:radical SAM/Cys-rich protein